MWLMLFYSILLFDFNNRLRPVFKLVPVILLICIIFLLRLRFEWLKIDDRFQRRFLGLIDFLFLLLCDFCYLRDCFTCLSFLYWYAWEHLLVLYFLRNFLLSLFLRGLLLRLVGLKRLYKLFLSHHVGLNLWFLLHLQSGIAWQDLDVFDMVWLLLDAFLRTTLRFDTLYL